MKKIKIGVRPRFWLLAALAAWLACIAPALAQPAKVWRVGVLLLGSPTGIEKMARDALVAGLREHGYVEGANLVLEERYMNGNLEAAPALAQELVRLKVDVIVGGGQVAARKATSSIPIVMANGDDPVAAGLVESLARPGGNVTGVLSVASDLAPKQLELIRSVLPALSRVAYAYNPGNAGHVTALQNLRAAGQKVKVSIVPFEAKSAAELEAAVNSSARAKVPALIVGSGATLWNNARGTVELAVKQRVFLVATSRIQAEAGALISYGVNIPENYRYAARYVDRILKGAKPADLPVEQPTRFDLAVNLKTAKALGLTIPQSVLVQADEVVK